MKHAVLKGFSIAALTAAVAACGGSDSGSATGTLSLGLTDAPVTDLAEVNLLITAVEVHHSGGQSTTIELDTPLDIDLLDFQGGNVATLFDDEELPAGQYEWIRLHISDNPDDLYVVEMDAPDVHHRLFLPSGLQTGLKLQGGFTVPAGGSAAFTIDFDVRKSIVNPQGSIPNDAKYLLKPAHRLIDNVEAGSIVGEVDYATINQDESLMACDYEGSVYVYDGAVAEENLSDLNVNETEGQPLVVVPVTNEENTTLYSYKAAFLTEGEYTISYACQTDDNEQDDTLEFLGTQTVTVVANQETTAETIPLAQ